MIEIISPLLGVLIGALIAIIAVKISIKEYLSHMDLREEMKGKMKEIDTLILLNKKINEILQKRDIQFNQNALLTDYEKVANFDDVKISIDDFIYLQTYCAQNHFYLPTYMVDEFFKNIAHRKVVLDPQRIRTEGVYHYQGGREVLEQFSEQLIQMIDDRKIELKQMAQKHYKK